MRATAYFDAAKMAADISDPEVREGAMALVQYYDLGRLRTSLAESGGTLKFALNQTSVTLKYGTHFFLGSAEAVKGGAL